MSWFRFYGEVINDPKVQKLTPTMFKHWVNVLCLASAHDGVIPLPNDVAFAMRIGEGRAAEMLDELLALNLLDADDEGTLRPHNWSARQYKSDTSTERVRKHRRNVSVTPPETEQNRDRSETETETEAEDTADAVAPPEDENLLPFEPREPVIKEITPAYLMTLAERFPSLAVSREYEKYQDYNRTKGRAVKDHGAAFRNWLRKAEDYERERRTNGQSRSAARANGLSPADKARLQLAGR